ncbi:uncharacterized protein LOC135701197 [Ochlerotatus camptorhynchus]|uniref:uncharacterized protein LOC135701197 n=1 Tax=Ochlerotatus camptorhynchus TaxID=644619 RepID=UPI0031DB22B5
MPLPPPDSNAIQDDQQAIAAAKAAAGTGHPVPRDIAMNSGGMASTGGSSGFMATYPGPTGADLKQARMAAGNNMANAGAGSGYGTDMAANAGGGGGYGSSVGSGMPGSGGYGAGMASGAGGYGAGMGGTGGHGSAGMAGAGGYGSLMGGAGGHGSAGMASGGGRGMVAGGGDGSVMTGNDPKEAPMYCYAQGPLLPDSLLPKPRREVSQVDVGNISCEEVVGYLMGLNRFYDRKCSRMGDKCPNKYKYAVSWYGKVGHQIMAKCDIAAL